MRIIAALFAAVLLTVACGGDDPQTQPTGGVQTLPDGAETDGAEATDAETGDAEATFQPPVGGGGEFCDLVLQLEEQFATAGAQLDFSDPAAVEDYYVTIQRAFQTIGAAAPPELAGDVQLVLEDFDRQVEALAAVGFDTSSTEIAYEQSPEVTEANERLEQYTEQTCGTGGG